MRKEYPSNERLMGGAFDGSFNIYGRGKTYYVYIIFNIETGFNVAHLLGGMLGETLTCEESIWPHHTMIQ
jgi:hypothetical protein